MALNFGLLAARPLFPNSAAIGEGFGADREAVTAFSDVGISGEGHIIIAHYEPESVGAGTWTLDSTSASIQQSHIANGSSADLDNISYKVYLSKGIYTLLTLYATDDDCAIFDIDIDGTEIVSIDSFTSGAIVFRNVNTKTGIIIATEGIKTLKVRVDGRNAGNTTGFLCRLEGLMLYRTS